MLKIKDNTIIILNDGSKHEVKNNNMYDIELGYARLDLKNYDDEGIYSVAKKDKYYSKFNISNLKELKKLGVVEEVSNE